MQKCSDCAVWAYNNHICPVFQKEMDKDQSGCPQFFYKNKMRACDFCHRTLPVESVIYIDKDHTFYLCSQCVDLIGTCNTCGNAESCDFETNPSTLPKHITKVIQQGGMRGQIQERNPERIKITCAANCKCWLPGIGCCKQVKTCGNWEAFYDKAR